MRTNANKNDESNIENLHKNSESFKVIKRYVSIKKKQTRHKGVTEKLILKPERIKTALKFWVIQFNAIMYHIKPTLRKKPRTGTQRNTLNNKSYHLSITTTLPNLAHLQKVCIGKRQ